MIQHSFSLVVPGELKERIYQYRTRHFHKRHLSPPHISVTKSEEIKDETIDVQPMLEELKKHCKTVVPLSLTLDGLTWYERDNISVPMKYSPALIRVREDIIRIASKILTFNGHCRHSSPHITLLLGEYGDPLEAYQWLFDQGGWEEQLTFAHLRITKRVSGYYEWKHVATFPFRG